jgi:hypothetical protein
VYPTLVARTPSSSLKKSSGFQNHPHPKYATAAFSVSGGEADGAHRAATTPTRYEGRRRRAATVGVATDAASVDAIAISSREMQ